MKNLLILVLSIGIFLNGLCSDNKYPSDDIPESLLLASKAVVRLDEQKLTMQLDGDILHENIYAITILDENAEQFATFLGPYDKYTRLKNVSGRVYNKEGELEETLRGEDILDFSMIASYSLYDESRIKVIDPEFHEYPYTVEYRSTYLMKSFLELPDWRVYPAYDVSVENSSFEITVPGEDYFRYSARGMVLVPEISETSKGLIYRWDVEGMPALTQESMSLGIIDISPILFIGPNDFNYGGHPGNMSSWQEFGKWIWDLGKDKQSIPEKEAAHITMLVKDLSADREKVEVVYKYMQDRVRYVNIVLGIGGFEPIAAEEVSDVGYGDCKALSNYMKALLNLIDIPSYYTLVMAGNQHRTFNAAFPSQQFNHAILAVPQSDDTIWLECTSQRLPADYLGSFTDDREVLFITEQGGMLSRTPKFSPEENLQSTHAVCKMDSQLGARIEFKRSYEGAYYGSMLSQIHNQDQTEQKRSIQNRMRLAGFRVDNFSYEYDQDSFPTVSEKIEITVDQLSSQDGEYVPLQLGILCEELELPKRSRNRDFPVYIKRGSKKCDSVTYELPDNLEIHLLPDPVSIETPFGSYRMSVKEVPEGLLYAREVTILDGIYDPYQFNEIYKFYREVRSSDQKKAIFFKK